MEKGADTVDGSETSRKNKRIEKHENVEEVESVAPANGQARKGGSQAKAFLQEVKTWNTDKKCKRQPRRGENSRRGNMIPLPQNLQVRGS